MKRFFVYAGVAVFLFLIAACGGTDDSSSATGPTIAETSTVPSPMIPSPTVDDVSDREDDLRRAATEAGEAFFAGDNAKLYTFLASDYREVCPFGDFLGILLFGRGFLGDLSDADFIIDSVTFQESRAIVKSHWEINGVPLASDDEEDEYPDYWVLEDGDWKSTSDDSAPCELDFGGEDTETNECLNAYNKAVGEWNALYETNDSVYQQYTIGGEIGTGFEGWAEDNGYAEDFCTEE